MKRPQFGLRLMLLAVALVATISGWRFWVERTRNENRAGLQYAVPEITRSQLNLNVLALESELHKYKRLLGFYPVNHPDYAAIAENAKTLEAQITATKKTIDDLPK